MNAFPRHTPFRSRTDVRSGWARMMGWALSLFLLTQGSAVIRAAVHDAEIRPSGADNFLVAQFRCYLPPGEEEVRGVAVVVPGYNEDGRTWIEQEFWRKFAADQRLALLGCHFQGDATHDYSNARGGSGQALVRVLRDLAVTTGQRGLGDANFLVWGVSSGAQFAYTMSQEKPDRMFAFASLLGAHWMRADAGSRKVPGLFVSSSDQEGGAAERTRAHVQAQRALGATWAMVEVADAQAAMKNTEPLVRTFLAESLSLRQRAEARPGGRLENISLLDGWVVEHDTVRILPAAEVPRTGFGASSWFPSRSAADQWSGAGRAPSAPAQP